MNIKLSIELTYNIVADKTFTSEALNASEIIEKDIKEHFIKYLEERKWTKDWDNKYLDNISIKSYKNE